MTGPSVAASPGALATEELQLALALNVECESEKRQLGTLGPNTGPTVTLLNFPVFRSVSQSNFFSIKYFVPAFLL